MQSSPVDLLHRFAKHARALLVVAACLIVLALISFVAFKYVVRQRDAEAAREAAPAPVASSELRLGGFTSLPGTALLRAELVDAQARFDRASYDRPDRPARNLLFANAETGSARWLLEDNEHEIFNLKTCRKIGSLKARRLASASRS